MILRNLFCIFATKNDMKKLFLIIILSLVALCVNAQQNIIDSLLIQKANLEVGYFNENAYSETVNSLIFCYMNYGDYYNAQKICQQGIDKLISEGVSNNLSLRIMYSYSGLVDYNLKNYIEAMNTFAKVEDMCKEANSVDDSYIIASCNAALICNEFGNYTDMKSIMDQAVRLYELKYGSIFKIKNEKHFQLVNNYGVANYNVGNNNIAGKCYRYVIDNCKGTFESNNALPLALNNYSVALIRAGMLGKALNVLKQAKKINSIYAYNIAQNLVLANFARWNMSSTAKSLDEYNKITIDCVTKIMSDFPKNQWDNYWTKISMEVLPLNNMVAYFHHNDYSLNQAFNMTLFCRNLLMNSDKIIYNYIENSTDFSLKNQYSNLLRLKHDYLFKTTDSITIVSLKTQIRKIEDSILHNINNLRFLLNNTSKSLDDVKESLSDGEYAIEYAQMFAPAQDGEGTDTTYCALVIGKNFAKPKIALSVTVKTMDSIFINQNGDALFYSSIYQNRTMALYKILFSEIESFIPNAHTIYYSPCGNLSQLNFDLFMDDAGIPLCQKYKMVRVSSTANIPEVKSLDLKSAKTASLYGGIDYKNSSGNAVAVNRGIDFANLPNSANEIKNINTILSTANINTDTLCGTSATEDSFKQLSGHSPDILHVATHGFYLDEESQKPFAQSVNTYSQKEAPMVLSGLALSGADIKWKGNFEDVNSEDGILTAYEISQLDLSNTRLAVLSACETARGRIFPVDGVFGLQRAFKQAGAGAILMSLWKVNDAATSLFMQHFYKSLMQTGDRHKALNFARNEVKKDFPDPYYWAAWVMLD